MQIKCKSKNYSLDAFQISQQLNCRVKCNIFTYIAKLYTLNLQYMSNTKVLLSLNQLDLIKLLEKQQNAFY